MKEELQTALVELIQKTLQGVDSTKDFLTAEIPDVVEQLLLWHGTYTFVEFAFTIILIIVMCDLYNIIIKRDTFTCYSAVVL